MKIDSRKTRISITIMPGLNLFLSEICKSEGISKSEVIEDALKTFLKNRLAEDAKAISQAVFDDLPSQEEWLMLDEEIDNPML